MENNAKNLFETFAETQKQVMENMTNATQQMAKSFMNTEMNSDFFKKWYDSQMSFFNQANSASENNPANMFSNWMNNQMNMGNEYMNTMQNNLKGMMGNMGMNNDMIGSYNNWMNSMNATMQSMMNNMNSNTDAKTAMNGMFNNATMMMKMYELWMPVVKMINDKTYTPEAFKNLFNPSLFKEMMDKMLNMQPDFVKNMADLSAVRGMMNNLMEMGKGNMDQMRNAFAGMNLNPAMFGNMTEQYNSMWNMMNQAAAPMMKMMGNTGLSNNMTTMNEMTNEFNQFMMKNAQVQYATYQAGIEATNEFAENVYTKMKNGDDMSNFMNVYSEWLNTNDKHLTKLFSTAEYSKMQAELNTFGMKLKQHMNAQMEKAMQNVPVVPRSEMDELYKTVHELKKRVNMLEKQLDSETEVEAPAKPAAKKATKNA